MLLLIVIVIVSVSTIWLLIITIIQVLKLVTRMFCSIVLLLIYKAVSSKSAVLTDAIERMSSSLEDCENVNSDLSFLIRFKKSKDLQLQRLVHMDVYVNAFMCLPLCVLEPRWCTCTCKVCFLFHLCYVVFVAFSEPYLKIVYSSLCGML